MTTTPTTPHVARRHTVPACFEAAPRQPLARQAVRPTDATRPAHAQHVRAAPPARSHLAPAALPARVHAEPGGSVRSFRTSAARHTPAAQPAHFHRTPACSNPGVPARAASAIHPTLAAPPAHPRGTREAA
jgi:hypothetical protein